eukprot:scaffold58120_cov69-Phaeocystis_antarctica.AAC.2
MASGSRAESLSRNKGAPPRPLNHCHPHPPPTPSPRSCSPRLHVLAAMVLSALSHKVTNKFKSFCKTELMDRFLYACIEYFTFFFELQARPQPWPAATHAAASVALTTASLPAAEAPDRRIRGGGEERAAARLHAGEGGQAGVVAAQAAR